MQIKLLNTDEVASILGVKRNTLEGWRVRGTGPVFRKIGSLVRYAESDIEFWLVSQSRISSIRPSLPPED